MFAVEDIFTEKDRAEGLHVKYAHQEGMFEAKLYMAEYLQDWREKNDSPGFGEPAYCGFAWVTLYGVKLSTKVGKEFKKIGFRRAWDGDGLQLWNPGGYGGQSMDLKEVGAKAYAQVLQNYGFEAYASSRAD